MDKELWVLQQLIYPARVPGVLSGVTQQVGVGHVPGVSAFFGRWHRLQQGFVDGQRIGRSAGCAHAAPSSPEPYGIGPQAIRQTLVEEPVQRGGVSVDVAAQVEAGLIQGLAQVLRRHRVVAGCPAGLSGVRCVR